MKDSKDPREESVPKPFDIDGYLNKQGAVGAIKGWKKRYFSTRNGNMFYSKLHPTDSEDDKLQDAIGLINLSNGIPSSPPLFIFFFLSIFDPFFVLFDQLPPSIWKARRILKSKRPQGHTDLKLAPRKRRYCGLWPSAKSASITAPSFSRAGKRPHQSK